MKDPNRIDPDKIPECLVELGQRISALPARYVETLTPTLEKVKADARRRRRIMAIVQESLGQLRMDIKYLMFDLEATRQERDEAQEKMI